MESQWGRNIQDIFFPWSFLNSVTNDTLPFWGLWPEKTHHDQGGSRLDTKSNLIAFCPVLSGYCSRSILVAFVYHWNWEGVSHYVQVPNPKGTRHTSVPPLPPKQENHQRRNSRQGTLLRFYSPMPASVLQLPPLFCHHLGFWHLFVPLAWLQKCKYLFVVFRKLCYTLREESQRRMV